jgi:hypothetical protein
MPVPAPLTVLPETPLPLNPPDLMPPGTPTPLRPPDFEPPNPEGTPRPLTWRPGVVLAGLLLLTCGTAKFGLAATIEGADEREPNGEPASATDTRAVKERRAAATPRVV